MLPEIYIDNDRKEDVIMNNIVIFGAAPIGLRLKRELEAEGITVNCFCDNNLKKCGCKLDGIDIVPFEEIIHRCDRGEIEGIVIAVKQPDSIVDQIRQSQADIKTYGLTCEYIDRNLNDVHEYEKYLFPINVSKPRLDYFEYHVAYHCNLKCKGCGHYSNIAPKEFGDFEKYSKDLHRLKELFWGIKTVRLMGGEPLLNPALPDFCRITRQALPDADIRVVTNGLLIPSVNVEVLETMRENYIGFDITQYPPTSALKEKIELRCLENGVLFGMTDKVKQFFSMVYTDGNSDKKEEYEKCNSKKCHILENGRLSVCGIPILNKKFGKIIGSEVPVFDEDIIDIYDDALDGFKINDLLSKPIEFCRYCDNDHLEWFDWQGNL